MNCLTFKLILLFILSHLNRKLLRKTTTRPPTFHELFVLTFIQVSGHTSSIYVESVGIVVLVSDGNVFQP